MPVSAKVATAAAQSICAALYAREKGAGGQHIVLPMLDTAIAFFFPDGYMSKGLLDDPANRNPTLAQTYRLTRTADGNIVYFCASDAEFHALFRSLDHPEWVTDPRYCGPAQRLANIHELGAAIVEAFETFTTADIYARMVAEEVPCGPVLDLDEIPDDPQVINNGSMRVREHPVIGRVREANQPVRYGTTPTEITPLAPTQGQHSDEILTELGRTPEQIAALRASGIVTGAVTAR